MSPPSTTAGTLRKVASARWLRLPSEPEYSESGRTKEMESYLALKKLLDEDALRKKKANVPESKWDPDFDNDDDQPGMSNPFTGSPGDKDKPLPTDKPLPALPDDARPMTAGAAGATPQVPINDPNFKFLGSEVASNNPSVRYRKRDKLKAFFKFNNPFAKKEDNSDLFVNTLANPVTTPVKGNENQPINRDGLTALPPMPSWAYGDPPSPSTATMPSSERSATSKKHLFNKGKGAE